ncbi:MAG: AI-2E family transporter [Lachnospiraceae bacterium]
MPKDQNHSPNQNPYRQLAFYIIGVILVACIIFRIVFHWNITSKTIHKFFSTVSPFFIGALIAYMVNPLCNYFNNHIYPEVLKLSNKKATKMLSVLSAYFIVLGLVIVGLIYIIPQLISSLLELTDTIPVTVLNVSAWLTKTAATIPFLDGDMINKFTNTIFPNILSKATELISTMIPMLYSASVSAIRWIINLIISIVISIYILSDKQLLSTVGKKILFSFLPEKKCLFILSTLHECNNIFSNFIIGKLIDSLIIGILCFIGMSILKLPYAMLISVIVGITNMIPYFGPFIGAVPGTLLLVLLNFKSGLIFLALVLVLQQFDGLILGPKILGNSTGVRPLGILFAITVGGAYAGVLGMFLGVPIFAVMQYLASMFIDRQLNAKKIVVFNEEEEEPENENHTSERLKQFSTLISEKIADGVRIMRERTDVKNKKSSSSAKHYEKNCKNTSDKNSTEDLNSK